MKRILKWIINETLHIIPAVIYFCIAFNLIYFTIGLSLRPDDVRYFSYYTVTLLALVAGKVVLIANAMPFINAFPHKPLIYNIIWKFFVYGSFVFIIAVVHNFLHLFFKFNQFSLAEKRLELELLKPVVWSTLIWLLLVFLIFVIFTEIFRGVGSDKIKKLLFGK